MYDDKLSVIKNVRNFGSVRKKEGLRLIGDENIQSHLTGVVNAGCSVFNSHAAIPIQQPAPHVRRATESSREDYIRLEHMSAMIPESFPEDNTQFPHLGVLSVSVRFAHREGRIFRQSWHRSILSRHPFSFLVIWIFSS
jgi:hypothetical protein